MKEISIVIPVFNEEDNIVFFHQITLILLGLIADILVKSYYGTTRDKSYNIKETYENN